MQILLYLILFSCILNSKPVKIKTIENGNETKKIVYCEFLTDSINDEKIKVGYINKYYKKGEIEHSFKEYNRKGLITCNYIKKRNFIFPYIEKEKKMGGHTVIKLEPINNKSAVLSYYAREYTINNKVELRQVAEITIKNLECTNGWISYSAWDKKEDKRILIEKEKITLPQMNKLYNKLIKELYLYDVYKYINKNIPMECF